LTHGARRQAVLDKIRDSKPPMELLLARSKLPPPPNEIFKALLAVCNEYGRIKCFGNPRCGFLRQRYWASLNYLTVLTFTCFGLRPNEGTVLRRQDFVFDPLKEVQYDYPPYIWVYRGDTADGEPKADSTRALPIPTNAVHLFKEHFGIMSLLPGDYILSGKDSGLGYPVCVDHLELRFKKIGQAAALKFPDLKINPKGDREGD